MRDATERLLQALGPSIEAELDRAITETHQQLEDEFQTRLQTALRAAERDTQQLADARLEDVRTEAREAARIELTESFDAQMELAARQIRSDMQAKVDEELQVAQSRWAAERSELQSELGRFRVFADAQRQLSESTSQTEILYRFLQLSEPFASSLAIYVSKSDSLSLWQFRGGVFSASLSDGRQNSELYSKSIAVRERVVGAVVAKLPCDSVALDFLISCLERAIETFGMRMRTASPRPPVPQPANGSHV
jgi:hypothetical protein